MRSVFIVSCVLLIGISAFAQQKKKWYLMPQAGLVNVSEQVSAQVMLSGGIVHNGWDIGLGIAADYYSIRTVPVVLDLRKGFGKLPLFGYTNLGYNIAAPLSTQYMYATGGWNHTPSSFSNGWYGELGLGYDFSPKKNSRFVLSLGYSLKTITEKYTETIPRDFPPYYNELTEHRFDYHFNRVIFKMGFRL